MRLIPLETLVNPPLSEYTFQPIRLLSLVVTLPMLTALPHFASSLLQPPFNIECLLLSVPVLLPTVLGGNQMQIDTAGGITKGYVSPGARGQCITPTIDLFPCSGQGNDPFDGHSDVPLPRPAGFFLAIPFDGTQIFQPGIFPCILV